MKSHLHVSSDDAAQVFLQGCIQIPSMDKVMSMNLYYLERVCVKQKPSTENKIPESNRESQGKNVFRNKSKIQTFQRRPGVLSLEETPKNLWLCGKMKQSQTAALQASGIQTSLLEQEKLKTPSFDFVSRKMKRRMKTRNS